MVSGVPHASKRVLHLDIADSYVGMTLDFLEELSLCWYNFFQRGLEVWLGGRGVGPYRWYVNGYESGLS